jgi:hypothetical protein
MSAATHLDEPLAPHPLLSTTQLSDFGRNFTSLEKHAKRPYSLCKVIRGLSAMPYNLNGFEAEVNQELRALNGTRNTNGVLVPIEVLSPWRRDLTTTLPVIQTTVSDQSPISFLRAKSICARLGATLLDGLVGGKLGNLKLSRATTGGVASWQPEIGPGTDSDQSFDSFTIIPKRISGSTLVSKQLVYQSSPDIEAF